MKHHRIQWLRKIPLIRRYHHKMLKGSDMSTADERAPPEPEHSWAAAGSNWTLGNDNQHSTPNIKRSSTSSTSQPGRCPSDTQELHVVGWDGPDDPKNPMNWPLYRKVMILSCVSMITLLTYVNPALPPMPST